MRFLIPLVGREGGFGRVEGGWVREVIVLWFTSVRVEGKRYGRGGRVRNITSPPIPLVVCVWGVGREDFISPLVHLVGLEWKGWMREVED